MRSVFWFCSRLTLARRASPAAVVSDWTKLIEPQLTCATPSTASPAAVAEEGAAAPVAVPAAVKTLRPSRLQSEADRRKQSESQPQNPDAVNYLVETLRVRHICGRGRVAARALDRLNTSRADKPALLCRSDIKGFRIQRGRQGELRLLAASLAGLRVRV